MSNDNDPRRLGTLAKQGVRDLPSNAGWLLRKAFRDPDGQQRMPTTKAGDAVPDGVRNGLWRAREKVADSVPFGSDTVDVRLQRAHAAVRDAQRAEQAAIGLAEEAKQVADEAAATARANRDRRAAEKKQSDEEVRRRTAEARRRADEEVAAEKARAQQDEADRLAALDEELDEDDRQARERAERAKARAQSSLDDATRQLAEARALAEDAAQAAQAAADDAHRDAEALAQEARGQAEAVDERVAESEQLRRTVVADAAAVANASPTEDLKSQTKAELLELAAALDVPSRSSMRKPELISAIRKTTRAASSA